MKNVITLFGTTAKNVLVCQYEPGTSDFWVEIEMSYDGQGARQNKTIRLRFEAEAATDFYHRVGRNGRYIRVTGSLGMHPVNESFPIPMIYVSTWEMINTFDHLKNSKTLG